MAHVAEPVANAQPVASDALLDGEWEGPGEDEIDALDAKTEAARIVAHAVLLKHDSLRSALRHVSGSCCADFSHAMTHHTMSSYQRSL